jgi:hypothetical protein
MKTFTTNRIIDPQSGRGTPSPTCRSRQGAKYWRSPMAGRGAPAPMAGRGAPAPVGSALR